MKLNKVLALALSGVMAVSMLAGCKGETGNGDQDNSSSQVVVSDAAAVMNKAQSKVEFKADPTLDSVLDAAIEKLTATEIKNADLSTTSVNRLNNDKYLKTVYNYMDSNLPSKYAVQMSPFDFSKKQNKDELVQTVIYAMKSGAYDEDTALAMIVNDMKVNQFLDTYVTSPDNKSFTADYTGGVSIKNVTKTAEDGKTYGAYIVAVTITQTATEVNK